jgi:hypothetical protein
MHKRVVYNLKRNKNNDNLVQNRDAAEYCFLDLHVDLLDRASPLYG